VEYLLYRKFRRRRADRFPAEYPAPSRNLPPRSVHSGMDVAGGLVSRFYGDWMRREAIVAFHADQQVQHSFFISLHQVPREFQFYVHAAVLRDCVPYIWSYRELSFIPLEPNTAVNVLPQEWLEKCAIKRSQ
jgi:hypothetical protein